MVEHMTSTQSLTVVVTGANGFVGARTCAALVERGARVRAVVRRAGAAPRLDGVDKASGSAKYAADINTAGTLYARLLTFKGGAAVIKALDVAAAEDRHRALKQIFGGKVGLVHGRMKGPEKDKVMAAFAAGELSVLVATTVIEVGVDEAKDPTTRHRITDESIERGYR